MIPIEKAPAPRELGARIRDLKKMPGVVDLFSELREVHGPVLSSLIAEQGYLCSYCMRRISLRGEDGGSSATIEHIVPQHGEDGELRTWESVDYQNMLAVCDGHVGCSQTTSDKHRGNAKLTVNPLKPHTLVDIRYGSDGHIYSTNEDVNKDLTETLNLNARGTMLCESRRAVIDEINRRLLRKFASLHGPDAFTRKKKICEQMLKRYEGEGPKKAEYLGVARFVLERRIKKYAH